MYQAPSKRESPGQSESCFGKFVVLRGEKGLGKKGLIEILRYLVQTHGAIFVEVECSHSESDPEHDFLTFVRGLVTYGAQISQGDDTSFAERAVNLARLAKESTRGEKGDKFRAELKQVCQLVLEASRNSPFHLHFHDIHEAGPDLP